jgi:hypothetical protein
LLFSPGRAGWLRLGKIDSSDLEEIRMLKRTLSIVIIAAGIWSSSASAAPYSVMFERTTDAVGGAELAFRTYASFADVLANIPSGADTFSPINIAGIFNTTGLTWDGSQYVQMFERTTDAAGGAELAFRTYATFADVLANIPSGPDTFSPINIAGIFDTTGLTWDGSQYIQMFERTTDAAGGAELAFRTYATFADMLANITSGPDTFSPINIAGIFNTTGLASEWQPNGGGNAIPEPGALALLGLGLLALTASRRRRSHD